MKPRRNSQTAPPANGRRWGWVLAAIAALIGVSWYGYWRIQRQSESPSPDAGKKPATLTRESEPGTLPVQPVSASPYLNARPGVQYVGSQICTTCHEDQHASFQHTGMGQSMAKVDLSREPPDGAFDHTLSKCRYEVRRKDGQMWHRELLITGGSEEVLLQEYPVVYVTGSGRHSLTYLVEDDGFFMESPITWYASRQAWGMSPGYDVPKHGSFQREIGEACLVCHAGEARAIGKSFHRMQIGEAAISCEQCHGPGELHVKRHEKKIAPTDQGDETIVNPARLPRDLSEAVCQQCHLRASAASLRQGRTFHDFRPGLPLTELRLDYKLDLPNQEMTVVGHVEQMHQSLCYQKSSTFSCLTCHDPHFERKGAELQTHYKQVCSKCHEPAACGVDPAVRAKENPENHCVACHMPATPTDIPHLAFTHHRVAVHKKEESHSPPMESTELGTLRPVLDISTISEREQRRGLGLAYQEMSNNSEGRRKLHFQQQALALLTSVQSSSEQDGTLDVSVARLRQKMGLAGAQRDAQSALADPKLAGTDLCDALFVLADTQFRQQRFQEALVTLEPLNKLRRSSMPWLLQAQCCEALGNEKGTEEALQRAVHIEPRLWRIHQRLSEIYRQRGDERRAKFHEARAVP